MSITNQLKLPFSTKQKKLLFTLPIAQRLTLGFLLTALIAALLAGGTTLVRIQSLHQQSDFYQQLLQTKITLASGNDFLKMMNIQMYEILTIANDPISLETLQDDESQLQNLIQRYDTLLNDYATHDLLINHPEQIALLSEAHQDTLVTTQSALARSALRTWAIFKDAQLQILANIKPGDIDQQKSINRINLERIQGEPMFSDTQSAISELIRFNDKISQSARDAVSVEESNKILTTTAGIILAIVSIALIGLFISNTVVHRLKQLHQITKAVEQGETIERIHVRGNDEIADISASVNAMLETIASKQEIIIASELKSQFITNISHELHNPLTKLFHWLEILINYHQELDDETQMRFLGRAMYGCQEIMQIVASILQDGTNFDDVVLLLEKKVGADQIKQWLRDDVKLNGVATLFDQGIESPVVTQLIKNKADLRSIATNSQILLDGGVRVDLINGWLKNGTHLNDTLAIMHQGVDLNLIGTSKNVGDFTGLTGATPNEVVSRIPTDAIIEHWIPETGRIEKGMAFKWPDVSGKIWIMRMHEADPNPELPAWSNAARGWVLRVRRSGKYMDAEGNFYTQNALTNPDSTKYDPNGANATHMPIQAPSSK